MVSTGLIDKVLRKSILYSNFVRPPAPENAEPGFSQSEIYDPVPPLAVDRAWELTQKLLLQLHKEVHDRNIPLVFLVVPEVFQIDFTSVGKRETDPPELPTLRAHARISEFLSRNGLNFVDLRAPLQEAADRGQRPYFEHDYHWNRTGHDVVAEYLYEWLVDRCGPLGLPISTCGNGNRASSVPSGYRRAANYVNRLEIYE